MTDPNTFAVAHIECTGRSQSVQDALEPIIADWHLVVSVWDRAPGHPRAFVIRGSKLSPGFLRESSSGIERAKHAVMTLLRAAADGGRLGGYVPLQPAP